MTPSEKAARDEALAMHATFCKHILPLVLRRIAGWRRVPVAELGDLADDLGQEIALDCLEHTAEVLALPLPARHRRWMRLADRFVYRRTHHRRRHTELRTDVPAPPVPRAGIEGEPAPGPRRRPLPPPPAPEALVRLQNGRLNLGRSAARCGSTTRRLRRALQAAADGLGVTKAHDRFWRRRLAEAMTGLGADLLRTRTALRVIGPLQPPQPGAHWLRLRCVASRLQIREGTQEDRRLVRPWLRRFPRRADAPRRLLEHAVQLAPDHAPAWLWRCEERLAAGDLRAALAALRSCRRLTQPPRGSVTLARARLLEMRGRRDAAVALLRRAARRWPFERNLRAALAAIDAALPPPH